jgi:endonuclease-3
VQYSLSFENGNAIQAARDVLLAVYGPQGDDKRHDPTSQLFKAMLGSCTRDAVSQAAFGRLQRVCRSWDELPDADARTIAAIISGVEHAPVKAVRLVIAARTIRIKRDGLDLTFLAGWPTEAAMSWLRELRGVDVKTAAVTLNFSTLRQRVLAVDRHVLRVSRRLGLVPANADFGAAFRTLMRVMPDHWNADDLYELHWLFKLHSQTICRHQHPICAVCPLARVCPLPN